MRPWPVVVGALLAMATSSARSDDAGIGAVPSPEWRVLVGGSFFSSSFRTTHVSRYSPPFASVSHTSAATQTLPLDASGALGLQLGVERALGTHVGLQLLGDYSDAELSGDDADVTLREIVNASEVVRSVPLAEIEAGLAPPPLRLDPSFFSARLQLAFRF